MAGGTVERVDELADEGELPANGVREVEEDDEPPKLLLPKPPLLPDEGGLPARGAPDDGLSPGLPLSSLPRLKSPPILLPIPEGSAGLLLVPCRGAPPDDGAGFLSLLSSPPRPNGSLLMTPPSPPPDFSSLPDEGEDERESPGLEDELLPKPEAGGSRRGGRPLDGVDGVELPEDVPGAPVRGGPLKPLVPALPGGDPLPGDAERLNGCTPEPVLPPLGGGLLKGRGDDEDGGEPELPGVFGFCIGGGLPGDRIGLGTLPPLLGD